MELGIKRRYTRPYRPQANGKVERFWRTLNEDLLHETTFESVEELKEELWSTCSTTTPRDPTRLGGQDSPPNPRKSVNELADTYNSERSEESKILATWGTLRSNGLPLGRDLPPKTGPVIDS